MNEVLGYVFAGIIYSFIIAIILGWISFIIYKIKCGKKKNCLNEKCPYRIYCNKTAQTPREKEELNALKQEILERLQEPSCEYPSDTKK